jgi:hypothetical protein
LALGSIGVLAIADKVKLILWIIAISVLWVISKIKKRKKNELA